MRVVAGSDAAGPEEAVRPAGNRGPSWTLAPGADATSPRGGVGLQPGPRGVHLASQEQVAQLDEHGRPRQHRQSVRKLNIRLERVPAQCSHVQRIQGDWSNKFSINIVIFF